MTRVYKIVGRAEWAAAQAAGVFRGAEIDLKDGYIHLSTATQAQETARRHFVGRDDLLVLELDTDDLGEALRWEPSRGGDLFPHLYAPLAPARVRAMHDAPPGADGVPALPDLPA